MFKVAGRGLICAVALTSISVAAAGPGELYSPEQARKLFDDSTTVEDVTVNSQFSFANGMIKREERCAPNKAFQLADARRQELERYSAYKHWTEDFRNLQNVSFECQACLENVNNEPLELKVFTLNERPRFEANGDLVFKGSGATGKMVYRCINFKGSKHLWSVWNALRDGGVSIQFGKMNEAELKKKEKKPTGSAT